MGLYIFFGVLLVASIVVSAMSLKQVSQGTVMLVERFGSFHRVLKPGISFIIPVVDSIKTDVTLYTYLNDAKQQQTLITSKGGISTREEILDPGPFDTIASDNTIVHPDLILYFRIVDPAKAVYGVSNLGEAMLKLVETILRQEIGKLDSDALLSSRDVIGAYVRDALERASEAWGTKIMRVEIQELNFSSEIQDTLTRAREAELIRRAKVVSAKEERDIEILHAEGKKLATMKIAEGNFEAAKLQAEADYLLASKKLEGEAKGIKAVAEAMRENPDAIVAIKALEAQQKIAEHLGRSGNMMILPAETAGLVGAAGSIIKGLEFTRKGGFTHTQSSRESES